MNTLEAQVRRQQELQDKISEVLAGHHSARTNLLVKLAQQISHTPHAADGRIVAASMIQSLEAFIRGCED